MPTEFPYLTRQGRGGERGADESVEARYRLGELAARPVIWDEYRRRYLVFESRGEFLGWYDRVPAPERCMHEVVFGGLPQRLKFDIDAPAHKLGAVPDAALREGLRPRATLSDADFDDALAGLLGEPAAKPADAADSAADEPEPEAGPLDVAAKARAVVNLVIEAVLDELHVAYYGVDDICPARGDLAVTDSSGRVREHAADAAAGAANTTTAAHYKYSYHLLVLPYCVAGNDEAREFTERVLERLPPPVRPLVDPGVNKRTQNFRLAGSTKPGCGRYKLATAEAAAAFGTAADVPVEELFVTGAPGARVLPRVYTDPDTARRAAAAAAVEVGPEALRAVLARLAAAGVTDGHEFREARGALLCFDRRAPSGCRICGEVHHRDNSLMVSLEPAEAEGGAGGARAAGGGAAAGAARGAEGAAGATRGAEGGVLRRYRVVEHCRQAPRRGRAVAELELDLRAFEGVAGARRGGGKRTPATVAAAAAAAPGLTARIAERVAAIRAGRADPREPSRFEALPPERRTEYAEPAMRPYELCPTLAVLAQMKLGKTKATRAFLDAHFPADGLETRVVRFVTFRQTFSQSLAEAFPDFTVYSDVQGDLDHVRHPRLIVQVESLHRLRMPARAEPVDLLILDEAESILAQFSSGLHRYFHAAFAMFQWMMRTARHVLVLDANLGDRTFAVLERMRPAAPPRLHWNRFQRAADDAYHFTADQGAWLARLHAEVRAGRRVVLPTNSLAEARAFEEGLRLEFPDKRVRLYSSETAPSERARHFADVHTHWSELDVLIYTPTCSAGVSYERAHFDALFGYFCDLACDVETCRQMLGRVRNLATGDHYVCLRARPAALPATVADLRRLVYDKRAGLYRRVEDNALGYEYEAEGAVRYYETDYFALWLETRRIENLSRNDFARRFVDQVAATGARVGVLDAGPPGAGAYATAGAAAAAHAGARADVRETRAGAVAAAPELGPAEAARVREAMRAQADVEPAQRLGLEKWALREAYEWHGRPLDAAFVAAYGGAEARRVYRNLRAITEGETLADSLALIRRREADAYGWAMAARTPALAATAECRDLQRERGAGGGAGAYAYQAHLVAVWLLRAAGLPLAGAARIHEAALEARLRAAAAPLARAAERIAFEFAVPRPRFDRIAAEPARAAFLTAMLRVANGVLRHMYGVQIRRVGRRAGGDAFYLGPNDTGRLFVLADEGEPDDTPGGPRPHVASRLRVEPYDPADVFIEAKFYEGGAAAAPDSDAAAAPDSDAAAAPDPAPAPDPDPGATTPPASSRGVDADLDAFLEKAAGGVSARALAADRAAMDGLIDDLLN